MSKFTELAQQAYESYHSQDSTAQPWDLKTALSATMPFLQAFQQADAHEWQAMWTEYCHLGDLLYTLERHVQE